MSKLVPLLDGIQGAGTTPDVRTDAYLHERPMTIANGRAVLARSNTEKYLVLDAEDAFEGPRRAQYATRARQIARDSKTPVSVYCNVGTQYYWFRDLHGIELAKRGVAAVNASRQKTIAEWLATPVPDVSSLVRQDLLDASAWAVPMCFLIDDATEAWEIAAIPYQAAALCRSVTSKPVVGYICPELYASEDFASKGLSPMWQWETVCRAAEDTFDSTVLYGFIGDGYTAANLQPYRDVAAGIFGK